MACSREKSFFTRLQEEASKTEVGGVAKGYFGAKIENATRDEAKRLVFARDLFSKLTIPEIHRLQTRSDADAPKTEEILIGDRTRSLSPEEDEKIDSTRDQILDNLYLPEGVSTKWLADQAKAFLGHLKEKGIIGEIYEIAFHKNVVLLGIFNHFRTESVVLSPVAQEVMDRLFLRPTPMRPSSITPTGRKLVESGELTEEELLELRAIRASTQLFERETFLSRDRGCWMGNFYGQTFPGLKQTVCHEEAITYHLFMEKLKERGLLKHFSPMGTTLRVGHEATMIWNQRTSKTYVLDSWQENGGEPAQIVTLEDWEHRNDYNNLVNYY